MADYPIFLDSQPSIGKIRAALEVLFDSYIDIKIRLNSLEGQINAIKHSLEGLPNDPRYPRRPVLETIVEVEELCPVPQDENPQSSILERIDLTPSVKRNGSASEDRSPAKKARRRHCGYVSFKENQQQLSKKIPDIGTEPEDDILTETENIPPDPEIQQTTPRRDSARNVSIMVQEAGLADSQPFAPEAIEQKIQAQVQTRRDGSGRSKTPSGSPNSTDSQSDEWGIEGTMKQILRCINAGECPITVESLINKDPAISSYKRIIAARCFMSILKLKQYWIIMGIRKISFAGTTN